MFQKVKVLLQTLRLCSSNSQAVLQQHRRDSFKAQGNGENGFLQLIKRFPSLSLLARQIQCLFHTSSARTCVQLNSQESVCPTEFPSARSTKYKYYYYYNIVSCIQNKYTQRREILHCSCLGCESSLPVLSGLSLHGFPSTQNKFFRFEN